MCGLPAPSSASEDSTGNASSCSVSLSHAVPFHCAYRLSIAMRGRSSVLSASDGPREQAQVSTFSSCHAAPFQLAYCMSGEMSLSRKAMCALPAESTAMEGRLPSLVTVCVSQVVPLQCRQFSSRGLLGQPTPPYEWCGPLFASSERDESTPWSKASSLATDCDNQLM